MKLKIEQRREPYSSQDSRVAIFDIWSPDPEPNAKNTVVKESVDTLCNHVFYQWTDLS